MSGAGMRVIATAGHVDHGKSSLVRALTGTDPDRFAEEKARGLTIDLGFAFTTLDSGVTVAFVDVPGHVRFLKNMLAGVGAVRAAVLVVAATEGWMPQSEEHLRILELLGIDHGFVVLTKADLVDTETLELAQLEVEEHLAGTFLDGEAVVVCDSLSGRGLEGVRSALDDLAARMPGTDDTRRPRLWIDRVFSAKGAGTVVTGTLTGGSVAVDDELVVLPGGRPTRVRAVQSAHHTLERAPAGSRVALNLSGLDRDEVRRGNALVRSGQWQPTTVVDVALHLLPGAGLAEHERVRLKAYAGSGEHGAVVRVLDPPYARVFLDTPVPLAPGDRLILRDPGPDRTVGGAEVLDVAPTGRAREAPARLALPLGRRLLAGHPWLGIDDAVALGGLSPEEAAAALDTLVREGLACRVGSEVVETARAERLVESVGTEVDAHHAAHPLEPGADLAALAGRLGVEPDRLRALLEAEASGVVEVEHGRVRRPGHRADATTDPAAVALLDALEHDPFCPPQPSELGTPPPVVRALVRQGLAVESDGVVFAASALEEAARRLAGALAERPGVTVADVRDLLGSSRKYVLPILNELDRLGITRRRGDERVAGPRMAPAAGSG